MLNTRITLLFVCISSVLVAFTKANVVIVTRLQWGAVNPRTEFWKLDLPVTRVIICHTAGWACNDYPSCAPQLKSIQSFQMNNRSLGDISYNFLVGGDGNIYEGRGWEKQGDFTYENKEDSLGIAFIGDFSRTEPTWRSLEAAKSLINLGVRIGAIVNYYKVFGHRQVFPTVSPGDLLMKMIKQWPHWVHTMRPL